MSVKVSSWVWHGEETKKLAGNEMVLLLALADVADDNGRCRFMAEDEELTYATLAKKARVSERTVIRMCASLREGGLLDQVKGAKGRPNEFQILVPWAVSSGDNLALNESDSVTTPTLFGDNSDTRSSLKRIDVVNAQFDEFWSVYPRHVAKADALKVFTKVAKSVDPAAVVAGARRYASDPNLPEKQFIPHPTTWLNAGRWDDEPLPPRGGARPPDDFSPGNEWMGR